MRHLLQLLKIVASLSLFPNQQNEALIPLRYGANSRYHCGNYDFVTTKFIGEGGTGTVYAAKVTNLLAASVEPFNAVVKFAKDGSQRKILHECDILKRVEDTNVVGIEHCISTCPSYTTGPIEGVSSVVSILTPAFHVDQPGIVSSSLAAIKDTSIQKKAAFAVFQTAINLAQEGIISSDVQILCNIVTGDVLFIDFTEALDLYSNPEKSSLPLAFLEAQRINSFLSEALALVTPELQSETVHHALQNFPDRSLESHLSDFTKNDAKFVRKSIIMRTIHDYLISFD